MARNKQRRTERRADLVDAARRAMLEHGSAVRLNQVAEVAGLTSGAVLYHYPDLQELLLEAHRAGMERFYDQRLRAVEGVTDPVRKLVMTITSGLPVDSEDEDVRLLCELGGAAGRNTVYAALLTALYDRQVSMYQVILEIGAAQGVFSLKDPSLTIGRNLVALEDAYGYRMMARHPSIDHAAASRLILDYARLATGHPLPAD
ncbi:TetR/AcrR family transcriptional regulator [Streptacidiphilus jiangxiensis]|uniref:TetR/AcrR family transcriptional regulator n=1 Tax=Streptacidiphilus jiangxiensis TaxID=235985 RepID=UPI0005A9B618|nr:TetR family transcriptional regulator [Streptacidiphilus jiangxiensis]